MSERLVRLASSRLLTTGLYLLAVASLVYALSKGIADPMGSQDFQWSGSRALLEHRNPYVEYLRYRSGSGAKPYILSQAPNYPASSLVMLWPLAALPWPAAKAAWAVTNVVAAAALLLGLHRLAPLRDARMLLVAAALLLMATCFRNVVENGQHALVSLACFVWSLVLTRRRPWVAGVLLAVSWLKYTLTFPLSLVFLARRTFTPLMIAAGVHVLLMGLVAAWIHQPPQAFVLKPLQVALRATANGDMDIFGLAQRAGIPKSVPTALSPVLFAVAALASLFIRGKDTLLCLSLLALVGYTIFFHLGYDLIVLVFPFWYCLRRGLGDVVTVLFALLVALNWYGLKAVALLSTAAETVVHDAGMLLLYLTVVWLLRIHLQPPSATAAAPPAASSPDTVVRAD